MERRKERNETKGSRFELTRDTRNLISAKLYFDREQSPCYDKIPRQPGRAREPGKQAGREGVAGVVNHEVIASICYNLHPGAL